MQQEGDQSSREWTLNQIQPLSGRITFKITRNFYRSYSGRSWPVFTLNKYNLAINFW